MSANSVPIFPGTPDLWLGQVSAANTNRDGTGTLVTIGTANKNGTRIDLVTIQGIVTTTAGMVRLFLDNGVNVRLIKEIPVSAVTVSGTVGGFSITWQPTSDGAGSTLRLPDNSWILKASTNNAEAINVMANVGHF